MDRRTRFFVLAALICFAVMPVGLEEYREIAAGVGVVYLVLAVLSFLDDRGRAR